MMITQGCDDGKLDELIGQVTAMFSGVRQAARQGRPAHEVEQQTWTQLRDLGHQLLKHYFDVQGDGDLGQTVELADGGVVRRLPRYHRRTYQSVFGPIELDRVVYGSREGQKIALAPLDQRCQLPRGGDRLPRVTAHADAGAGGPGAGGDGRQQGRADAAAGPAAGQGGPSGRAAQGQSQADGDRRVGVQR